MISFPSSSLAHSVTLEIPAIRITRVSSIFHAENTLESFFFADSVMDSFGLPL